MANLSLEGLWRSDLLDKGWSVKSASRFQFCLAKVTLRSYNNVIEKLALYCDEQQLTFLPTSNTVIADFQWETADRTVRLNAILRTSIGALGHLYMVKGMPNVMYCPEIKLLVTGLVKSGTLAPIKRSSVMPIQNFHRLFKEWPDNEAIDIKQLCLKTITLLALSLMLRLSDIVPNVSVTCSDHVDQICFNSNKVQFFQDKAKFTFLVLRMIPVVRALRSCYHGRMIQCLILSGP